MSGKRIFITVGTTKFEKLILTATNTEILDTLQKLGYTSLQIQTGDGKYKKVAHEVLNINYMPYIEEFEEEIEKSDLIISHAGAGTCLEVLQKGKPLVVVINEDLMNNHQTELAEQLQQDGYLYYCTCDTLKETLCNKSLGELKLYSKPSLDTFCNYVDKCMGFNSNKINN